MRSSKHVKQDREWAMTMIIAAYLFTAVWTGLAIRHFCMSHAEKGFMGMAVVILVAILTEKIRRRKSITLAEIKNSF